MYVHVYILGCWEYSPPLFKFDFLCLNLHWNLSILSEESWGLGFIEKGWIWWCKGSVLIAAGVRTLSLHKWEQRLISCHCVRMETHIYMRGWFHKISNHGFTCMSESLAVGTCYFVLLRTSKRKYLGNRS